MDLAYCGGVVIPTGIQYHVFRIFVPVYVCTTVCGCNFKTGSAAVGMETIYQEKFWLGAAIYFLITPDAWDTSFSY